MARLKRDDALEALAEVARDAVLYVGMANYVERQEEALAMIEAKLTSLLRDKFKMRQHDLATEQRLRREKKGGQHA